MKIISVMVTMILVSSGVYAQPVINSPTNSQVLYVGDTININWVPRAGTGSNVVISVVGNIGGIYLWEPYAPNTGTYR